MAARNYAHECSSDSGWCVLSCQDRDCRTFRSHAQSKNEADDEELFPIFSEAGCDRSDDEDTSGDEDSTSATEESIERVGKPVKQGGVKDGMNSRSESVHTLLPL